MSGHSITDPLAQGEPYPQQQCRALDIIGGAGARYADAVTFNRRQAARA